MPVFCQGASVSKKSGAAIFAVQGNDAQPMVIGLRHNSLPVGQCSRQSACWRGRAAIEVAMALIGVRLRAGLTEPCDGGDGNKSIDNVRFHAFLPVTCA